MSSFYKGYVTCSDKKANMPFKGKTSDELLTLEQARRFREYAGILNDDTVLVDIDTQEETEILLKIVKSLNLNCQVLKSRSGGHFLFKIGKPMPNRTKVKLGIGITADIKGCGRASYEVLKIDGMEREVLYDNPPYQLLPQYLHPINSKIDLLGMCQGDGRNNALFSYILPLQQNEFTVEQCRECIGIINDFVLKDPLSEDEL